MALLGLFIAALMPVLKVLLLTAIGSFLAIARVNILGEDARKHLNEVVFFVFSPALVGSKLASYITLESLVKLWFMPVNILITFMVGSALGWILLKITRAPHDLWGLVLGCCAAGNMGNLLLIMIPAVCKEKGSPFGDVDVCSTHGLAYVSLSMAIGVIYLWSYVYNIARIYSSKNPEGSSLDDSTKSVNSVGEMTQNHSKCHVGPLLPLKGCLPNGDHMNQSQLDCPITVGKAKSFLTGSFIAKIKLYLQMVAIKINLKMLFAPSIIGAIVGFIVGIIPPFRKAMIGDRAPLRIVQDSASLLGEAAIPTITLIVGANLIKGMKGSELQRPLIIGIVVVRYIALPMFGVVIIKGAVHFGLVKLDPLYQFVLLLQYALPPAMNIGTITQLFGAGESECSVIMLWTYALASVSLTLWSTFFMWLVK